MGSKVVLGLLCILPIISTILAANNANSLTPYQRKIEEIRAHEGYYDPMTSRIAPANSDVHYTITQQRLTDIRKNLMYPYYDMDPYGGRGDIEVNINTQNTQVNKQLTFLFPYFGFGLNYTWVSLNGYLGFSNAPFSWPNYPLHFPITSWPLRPDPSFIGPFYSKCNIGQLKPGTAQNQKTPGVYWRLMRDLPSRSDQLAVEIRERLKWDIRTGMVGSTIFSPKHAIIVTWKNVTFAGGSLNTDAKYVTNTFQLVVATDEIRSYAMFNYDFMSWTSHTEAGGSSDEGQGGVPAYVGFNAGNGTRAYEYKPYSQSLYIRDLAVAGYANDIPGRHMFRIDEQILAGSCRREETLQEYPLVFSPDHANMMGGALINITGPCFELSYRVVCQFDTTAVEGAVIDRNTVLCIMPQLLISGYVKIELSINGGPFYWKGKFFVETPLTTTEGIWFMDDTIHQKTPEFVTLNWLAGNLTQSKDATVSISLWGYQEDTVIPQIIYIDMIAEGVSNLDREKIPYTIATADFANRDNGDNVDLEMGFLMINVTVPDPAFKLQKSTQLWSHPIPLAWYFQYQWTRLHDEDWETAMCDRWVENDRNLRNFAYEVETCPCLLDQAVADKGRFLPDYTCDKDGNNKCFYHYGSSHCVRTGLPNQDGAGQQCCYDRDGYLVLSADQQWSGHPQRAHNLGKSPYDEANKVPSLSYWFHDMIPYYTCCLWQTEQSPGCTIFRYERRVSQDCVGYQPPSGATVFGDPHFYTFDSVQYTFNGLGEFVLVRVDDIREVLDVQGRFERIDENFMGNAKGSMLTAVAARDNISSIVEVRRRPSDAMWRYHLDVIVDGRRVYFDRYPQKVQQFKACIVYTPANVLNQSHVIIMFSSGAGVEVMENRGYLGVRVYLPLEFANITRGLFGNWSFDPSDDFILPDGSTGPPTDSNNLELIHEEFGMKWVLDDKEDENKGKSLFSHDLTRSSNYYYHPNFQPEFNMYPTLPPNASMYNIEIARVCGDSYQCNFDYVTTLRRDFAMTTKYYQDSFVNTKENGLVYISSCGALDTPPHGRKSTFNFLSGAEVKFDCDPGFVLLGEQRRWCYASGDWNWPEDGEAACVTEMEFLTMQNGIVAGLILAVLIPILFAFCCFVVHCRNRVKIEDDKDGFSSYKPASNYSNGLLAKDAGLPNKHSSYPSAPQAVLAPERRDSDDISIIKERYHKSLSTDDDDSPVRSEPQSAPIRGRQSDIQSSSPILHRQLSEELLQSAPPHRHLELERSSSVASSTTIDSSSEAPLSSKYDPRKVYYTHEPVNDNPVVFQNVLWGVEDRTSSPASSASSPPPLFPKRVLHSPPSSSQESAV